MLNCRVPEFLDALMSCTVHDNAVAKAKTKHGIELRLAQEADALYEEAMRQSYQEAEAFEPHIGRAAEELDESWQQLMCTLSMDEQRNQQSGPKKKTIRMPSAPSSGRTPRSARRMGMSSAPATKPAGSAPPARPTSESARMYATFDAHAAEGGSRSARRAASVAASQGGFEGGGHWQCRRRHWSGTRSWCSHRRARALWA